MKRAIAVQYKTLLGTDLQLSEVGFGVWGVATNWWGHVDKQQAVSVLRTAFDLGITFFDTANVYGDGFGETVIAEALGEHREDIVIGTKFGYNLEGTRPGGHQERTQLWEPTFIRNSCESSLRQLQTDRIDLYQLHNPRLSALQNDDVFATLEQLVEEGKVRYFAAAIGPDLGWTEEGEFALTSRRIPAQIIYSLLEQQPARRFLQAAERSARGLITRVPHASGMLDGTYTANSVINGTQFKEGDHRAHRKHSWMKESIRKLRWLDFLLAEDATPSGATVGQIAIKFCLHGGNVASCLPTVNDIPHLKEYAAASDMPNLPAAALDCITSLQNNKEYLGESIRIRSSVDPTGWITV